MRTTSVKQNPVTGYTIQNHVVFFSVTHKFWLHLKNLID